MIRDYALFASGLLVDKIGGPSVKPYQPDGVWEAVAMPESNTSNYSRDSRRQALSPEHVHPLEAGRPARFDGPAQRPEPRNLRGPSRADQHPAPGLGHPQRRPVRRGGPAPGRADAERRPDASRPDRLDGASAPQPAAPSTRDGGRRRLAAALLAYYREHPAEAAQLVAVGESKPDRVSPVELAAWTMLANELMNLDEVLNK